VILYDGRLFFLMMSDFQTDGKWCYIVLWVVQLQHSNLLRLDWDSLKNRLLRVSPPCLTPLYYDQKLNGSSAAPSVYLLKFCCVDRKGLLHGKYVDLDGRLDV
jgi:hypothetical protein